MKDERDDHDAAAVAHHHDTHDDVAEARLAVLEAKEEMSGLRAMLGRHFRLGVLALFMAMVLGGSMLYVVMEVRSASESTAIQTVANEVEVLRHRVHSKESDLRLCTVALGARLGETEAHRICLPVLGPDFEATKAQLASEERRLAKLRAEAK